MKLLKDFYRDELLEIFDISCYKLFMCKVKQQHLLLLEYMKSIELFILKLDEPYGKNAFFYKHSLYLLKNTVNLLYDSIEIDNAPTAIPEVLQKINEGINKIQTTLIK